MEDNKIKITAIQTDDPDIRPAFCYAHAGGNGDWYLSIVEIKDMYDEHGNLGRQAVTNTLRISMSGSQIPFEIKMIAAQLCQTMSLAGFNEHPDNQIYTTLKRINK